MTLEQEVLAKNNRIAERVRGWRDAGLDVCVYFDNDVNAHAPFNALGLARRLGVGPSEGARVGPLV